MGDQQRRAKASREESGKDAQQPQGAGEEDEVVGSVHSLQARPTYVIQIRPADLAERQKRIGFRALGQRLFRELPEFDTRPQRDLDNGSEHRLCSTDHIQRREEPHSVDKPDQALLIAAGQDLIVDEGVQQQIRRAHYEISVNGFPLRDLTCDPLKAILGVLGVNGGAYRGAASYEGPQEQ